MVLSQALVFSQFTRFLEIIEWRLKREGISAATVLGSMPIVARRVVSGLVTSRAVQSCQEQHHRVLPDRAHAEGLADLLESRRHQCRLKAQAEKVRKTVRCRQVKA